MTYHYKSGKLHIGETCLHSIAEAVSTPCYLYSGDTIRDKVKSFRQAIEMPWKSGPKPWFAFAGKSNSNIAILKVFHSLGVGIDIVSGGELARCLAAGVHPSKIVFSGVGKTYAELEFAIKNNIHQINVESLAELEMLKQISQNLAQDVQIALRFTPDVISEAHEKTSTGAQSNKFGLMKEEILHSFNTLKDHPYLKLQALSMHIGSGVPRLDPFHEAFNRMAELVVELRGLGHTVRQVDLGGGLWVPYSDEPQADIAAYGQLIHDIFAPLNVQIVLEPGRILIAESGIILTSVILTKDRPTKKFAVVDAAMNDLIRPTLYDAYHEIVPVIENTVAPKTIYDVVGPICETGDYLGLDRELPELANGDLLAIMNTGAYGAAMSGNYNTRPLIPEVLVDGDRYFVIRERQKIEDIWAQEKIPDWLE